MGDNTGQGGGEQGGGGTIPFASPIPTKSSVIPTAVAAFVGGLIGAFIGVYLG